MSKFQKQENLRTFEPAQLFTGSIWYIQYKVQNPATGALIRKRIKCNRIKNIPERRKWAKKVINDINAKLYAGWNPFNEKAVPRGYEKLVPALESYLKAKRKELREDSIRSYESFKNRFTDWLLESDLINCYCINFSKQNAVAYMNFVYGKENISSRTYNNYRQWQIVFFNYLLEQCSIKENPFSHIHKKKVHGKNRVPVPEGLRTNIKSFLISTDFKFYIVTQIIYYLLVRPKEVCFLKPEYFDMVQQVLIIPGEATKNGQPRIITIPDVFMQELIDFDFNNAKKSQYIFSSDLNPGKTRINGRYLARKWEYMRNDMKLPQKYKLYSLRDTGIIQMLQDGISPEEVMKQADHSSLKITSIYAKFVNPEGSRQIKAKLQQF